jgi:DNA-binding protein H-NS
MTSTSYTRIQKQIEALQAKAAKLKALEVTGVVFKIKAAIEAYALTREDLFGSNKVASKGAGRLKRAGKPAITPKYADGKGGEWVGRGKRPRWLTEALAGGKKLEDFAVGAASPRGEPTVSMPPEPEAAAAKVSGARRRTKTRVKKKGKKSSAAKYSDGAGNAWSGTGRKPRWFVAALAAGKTPEDLAAKA